MFETEEVGECRDSCRRTATFRSLKSYRSLPSPAMGQFLRGENLHLRPLENETDVRTLYEIWNDPESVGEHLEFAAWSWDSFSKYIGGLDKSPDEQTFLLVVKNEGKDTVGFVNFRYPRPWRYTVEIGYQF